MAGKRTSRVAMATIVLAVLALLAGPLVKYGVVSWKIGLAMFALGSLLAGIGGLICLVMLARQRDSLRIAGAVVGLIAAVAFGKVLMSGSSVPRIHDITTDTANPPQFVAITPEVRGAGSNTTVYDPALARQQATAYPNVRWRLIAAPPKEVFDRALKYATSRGWAVAVADAATGRIEATETASWWGFKDDVVIRLTPDGAGTRIDVRSVSRVGEGDFGANAHRITALLDAVDG